MLSEAGVRRAARGPAGGIKAMSSASQLSGRYFHLTAIMSEVMDDNLFSHNPRFLISSSTVMIYSLMRSIRKKAMQFLEIVCFSVWRGSCLDFWVFIWTIVRFPSHC